MDVIHKLKILVMFLSLAAFMVMVMLNAANATGIFRGLFRSTPGNISAKYQTDFTPAGWTFLIWNVIYAWQLAWLLYALSGICRRNELGCVYIKPALLPICFYVVWILNNSFNVGWLFLWDREYLLPALVFLAALTFTTCACLFSSHRALSFHSAWFTKGHKAELWLIRILVQNGLALYAAWTVIATLLNFAIVLTYKWDVPREAATTASLSILTLVLVIWFYLENVFLDKFVRYNLTIYPVVITALTGSTCKNFSFSSPTTNGIFIGESLGLFPTLVKDGQKTLLYPSCESRAERQTCTWKVLFGKSRTRDFLEGFSFCKEKSRNHCPQALGLAPTSLPSAICLPCNSPLGSSAGSSIRHGVGQKKSKAGIKTMDFHLPPVVWDRAALL